jgi:hypothetical protein
VGGGRGGCRRFVIILRLDDRYDDDDQQEDNTQCHDGGPLFITRTNVRHLGAQHEAHREERPGPTLAFCHHIFLRTRLAPLRNDCADTARLSGESARQNPKLT